MLNIYIYINCSISTIHFRVFSQGSQAAIAGLAVVLGIVAVVGVLRRCVAGEVAEGGFLGTVPDPGPGDLWDVILGGSLVVSLGTSELRENHGKFMWERW